MQGRRGEALPSTRTALRRSASSSLRAKGRWSSTYTCDSWRCREPANCQSRSRIPSSKQRAVGPIDALAAMELLDWLIVLSLLGFIFAGNRRAASEKKSVAVSAPLHRWQRVQPVSRQFAGRAHRGQRRVCTYLISSHMLTLLLLALAGLPGREPLRRAVPARRRGGHRGPGRRDRRGVPRARVQRGVRADVLGAGADAAGHHHPRHRLRAVPLPHDEGDDDGAVLRDALQQEAPHLRRLHLLDQRRDQ